MRARRGTTPVPTADEVSVVASQGTGGRRLQGIPAYIRQRQPALGGTDAGRNRQQRGIDIEDQPLRRQDTHHLLSDRLTQPLNPQHPPPAQHHGCLDDVEHPGHLRVHRPQRQGSAQMHQPVRLCQPPDLLLPSGRPRFSRGVAGVSEGVDNHPHGVKAIQTQTTRLRHMQQRIPMGIRERSQRLPTPRRNDPTGDVNINEYRLTLSHASSLTTTGGSTTNHAGRVTDVPLILTIFPIFLIEAFTFWAVASWLGFGWALFTVFALMGIGMISTGVEMQRVSRLAAAKRISPGRLAGDYGLLTAGAILAATPGIASSIVGLLLIFPPTRALARRVLAARLVKSIENLGVRSFEATNANRAATSYGSFFNPQGPQSGAQADQTTGEVIDESEIVEWTRNIRPEDFTGPENPENPDKPGEKG